jgi:hypothetical protein
MRKKRLRSLAPTGKNFFTRAPDSISHLNVIDISVDGQKNVLGYKAVLDGEIKPLSARVQDPLKLAGFQIRQRVKVAVRFFVQTRRCLVVFPCCSAFLGYPYGLVHYPLAPRND